MIVVSTVDEPYPVTRVCGLFSARSVPLEKLIYTGPRGPRSEARITLVTSGTASAIEHLITKLECLIFATEVHDFRVLDLAIRHVPEPRAFFTSPHAFSALRAGESGPGTHTDPEHSPEPALSAM